MGMLKAVDVFILASGEFFMVKLVGQNTTHPKPSSALSQEKRESGSLEGPWNAALRDAAFRRDKGVPISRCRPQSKFLRHVDEHQR